MSSPLSVEQQRKIQENRQKALAIRARKRANAHSANGPHTRPGGSSSSSAVSTHSEQTGSSRHPPTPHGPTTTTISASSLGPPRRHTFIPPFKTQRVAGGHSVSDKLSENTPSVSPSSSSVGVAGHSSKPVAKVNSCGQAVRASSAGPPSKKPPVSVRGKCVCHSKGRFGVEVSYHAELIAVFKTIPSKNYGESLPFRTCIV